MTASTPQSAADTCVAYLGRTTWLIDGRYGNWAASYHYLTCERGMSHSQANHALVHAYRLNQRSQPALEPKGPLLP